MVMINHIKTTLVLLLVTTNLYFPGIYQDKKIPLEIIDETELSEEIESILNDKHLDGAIAGVSVRQADTGAEIFSQFGDVRLQPASNMKLLTGIAALETLGEDHQFTTEILTDGVINEGVLQGNLYIKGKGDPTLLKKDLDQFAIDLKKQGIKKIDGHLIGDDHWYDDVRLSTDLNWNDESSYTGAQVSALTLSPTEEYDAGTVVVTVAPAKEVGEQAVIQLLPETSYMTISNEAETVAKNETEDISIEREHGSNRIVITGTIPLGTNNTESWTSVWEPTEYVMSVFKDSLLAENITLTGDTKVSETPKKAKLLLSKKSIPLKDLLIPFMKLSNNGHGETLTKEMGKVIHDEGSWDKGLQVIQDTITAIGADGKTILLRDGSGMSHKTAIPASELSKILYNIKDKDWFSSFEKSLPVAGEPDRMIGGTLAHRMTDQSVQGNVRAKTGRLSGVSSLSGYVTAKNGEELIFSILINNHLSPSVRSIEDAIVTVLAHYELSHEN